MDRIIEINFEGAQMFAYILSWRASGNLSG